MNFKDYVIDNIVTLTQLERSVVEGAIETPPDEKMGDLAFPCFPLAKVLRKAPPMIAKELSEQFPLGNALEKVEAAGGYLNFFFNRAAFAKEIISGF